MAYFVDRKTSRIVVTAPGRPAPSAECVSIETDIVTRFANVLKHGAELSPLAADALCNGDPGGLEAELGAGDGVLPPDVDRSPTLPSLGRWEYKVISVSEVGGFATAKGTVGRIQETLDQMAADGWELVTTTARDSRWIGSETVILTFGGMSSPRQRFLPELLLRIDCADRRALSSMPMELRIRDRKAGAQLLALRRPDLNMSGRPLGDAPDLPDGE